MMHCDFRFNTCSRAAGFAVFVACGKGSETIFEHSVSNVQCLFIKVMTPVIQFCELFWKSVDNFSVCCNETRTVGRNMNVTS
jgi:hypothetical protein